MCVSYVRVCEKRKGVLCVQADGPNFLLLVHRRKRTKCSYCFSTCSPLLLYMQHTEFYRILRQVNDSRSIILYMITPKRGGRKSMGTRSVVWMVSCDARLLTALPFMNESLGFLRCNTSNSHVLPVWLAFRQVLDTAKL